MYEPTQVWTYTQTAHVWKALKEAMHSYVNLYPGLRPAKYGNSLGMYQ